jgi:beta-galactosidase
MRSTTYPALAPCALDDAEHLEWFGLGPLETYADRRSAATVARWKSTVTDQYVPYINPQDHGRHEATRWVHLHNGTVGVVVAAHPAERLFSFSARHFDDADLTEARSAGHLIPRAKTMLSIDHRVRGVGTGSCGPDTLSAYRIGAGSYSWSFALAAWNAGQDPAAVVASIRW